MHKRIRRDRDDIIEIGLAPSPACPEKLPGKICTPAAGMRGHDIVENTVPPPVEPGPTGISRGNVDLIVGDRVPSAQLTIVNVKGNSIRAVWVADVCRKMIPRKCCSHLLN